jgi:SAM-dependent methyltransferase
VIILTAKDSSKMFDAHYYAHGCGELPYQRDQHWLSFFSGIADDIVRDIQPATVLDAGCALGFLVESLRNQGVEAYGVDISEYAIENVHESIQPYCWVGSITQAFPQKYDLIVTIEVLEHMPKEQADAAVANLCAHAEDILFSSSPSDYKEPTHFNVQPPEYWADLFARHGFYRDVDFDASFITPWAVRFRKRSEPIHRLIRDYERRFWLLWKENWDLRQQNRETREKWLAANKTIQDQEITLRALESQRDEIFNSRSWKLIQRVHSLVGRLFGKRSG